MKINLWRNENTMKCRVGKERAKFVLDGRTRLGTQPCGVVFKFVLPEPLYDLVADAAHDLFAVDFVGLQLENIRERRSIPLKKRIEAVAQDMLHAHAPCVRPYLLERFEEAGNRERYLVRPHTPKGIVPEH